MIRRTPLAHNELPQVPNDVIQICSICNQPIQLEWANTDEQGLAVHEECYVMKLHREQTVSKKADA